METSKWRRGYRENQNGGDQCVWYRISISSFVVKMSFWTFLMCQVETNESLEGLFPGGLINHGKYVVKRFDSLYKLPGSAKFSEAWTHK